MKDLLEEHDARIDVALVNANMKFLAISQTLYATLNKANNELAAGIQDAIGNAEKVISEFRIEAEEATKAVRLLMANRQAGFFGEADPVLPKTEDLAIDFELVVKGEELGDVRGASVIRELASRIVTEDGAVLKCKGDDPETAPIPVVSLHTNEIEAAVIEIGGFIASSYDAARAIALAFRRKVAGPRDPSPVDKAA